MSNLLLKRSIGQKHTFSSAVPSFASTSFGVMRWPARVAVMSRSPN